MSEGLSRIVLGFNWIVGLMRKDSGSGAGAAECCGGEEMTCLD